MQEDQVRWKKDQVAWKSTHSQKSQFLPVKPGSAESCDFCSACAHSCLLRATRNEERFRAHAKRATRAFSLLEPCFWMRNEDSGGSQAPA